MKTTVTIAALLLAGSVSTALAKQDCTVEALNALHIAGVQVTQATPTAADGTQPAHCAVQGTMVTKGDGAPEGSSRCSFQMPGSNVFSSWVSAAMLGH